MKLPFKTTPRQFEKVTVGNLEIGELEFPKYGDLSPNERAYLKASLKDVPNLRESAVKFARKISSKSGLPIVDVYEALVGADLEKLVDHLEEFVEFQALMDESKEKRRLAMVTTLIRYRLNPKPEEVKSCELVLDTLQDLLTKYASNVDAPKLINSLRQELDKKFEVWNIQDTGNPDLLPPQLLDEITEFGRNEENGWQQIYDEDEQPEVTEEDLGKSSEETLPKNQTGEKSTGASNDIGQAKEDLTAETSETSQPG